MQVKKAAKRAGIIALVIAVVMIGLHFFIIQRAKQILNYIILEASNGDYAVRSKKVRFKYNPLSINATNLQVYPVDSLQASSFYTISADSVYLEVSKLWSLITRKNFSLGNVNVTRPLVKVYDKDTTVISKPLNIALSDMQQSLLSSLTTFNVEQCVIEDAGIAYQRHQKDRRPFSIDHIYLYIDSLHTVEGSDANKGAGNFKAFVKLFIDRPSIQLPDTSATVYIQNLFLDTRRNVFSVNRFNLRDKNINGTVDSISLSNIHLRHFNWNRWLKEGVVEIDSLKAFDGATFFDFSDKEIFTLKEHDKQNKSIQVNIPLLLHQVEINKIKYGLRTGSPSGPLTIQLNGDSLAVSELALRHDQRMPLQVGNLAFKVTRYYDNYENNRNESAFEKLIIDHNDLELINYYRSLNHKGLAMGSHITIPSLKVVNFSLDDLLQYRLKADKLILEKPALVIDIQKSERKRDADVTVAAIARSLQPSLDIKQLSIRDAAITLIPKKGASGKVTIENLDTEIDARKLLASKSVMDAIGAATALSTSGFRVIGTNIDLEVKSSILNPTRDGIFLGRVSGNIGEQVNLDLVGVYLYDSSGRFDVTKLQHIQIDRVNVEGGKVLFNGNKVKQQGRKEQTPAFTIDRLHAGSLVFGYINDDNNLSVNDIQLDGSGVHIKDGITSWNSLLINTGSAYYQSSGTLATASALEIKQPGLINLFNLGLFPGKDTAHYMFEIPKAGIYTKFMNTEGKALNADKILVTKPVIRLNTTNAGKDAKNAFHLPGFYAKELMIDRPEINFHFNSDSRKNNIQTHDGVIVFNDITNKIIKDAWTAQSMKLSLDHPELRLGETSYLPEKVLLNAVDLSFNTNTKLVKMLVDTAVVSKMPLHWVHGNKLEINGASAGLSGFAYQSSDSFSIPYLFKNANWWSNAEIIKQQTKQHTLTIYHPGVVAAKPFMSFDSLTLVPVVSRDSFWRSTPYEKDYNTLRLGYTELRNWRLNGKGSNTLLSAQYLFSDSLYFLTEKDKTHGPDTVTYRPLLARSFKKIPLLFAIDTVHIRNGFVKHNLLPEKTKKEATIYFSDINGFLYHVKNQDYKPSDSLVFRLQARLMGDGDLVVGFRQSYLDSLQAFNMRARMGSMNLAALNSLLVPMVSVKIDRGIADSLLLVVDGNDLVAFGSMYMHYHNLRLSLLKRGEGEYFLSKFYNWLLNVVVRSKDNSKKKSLYQERLRNKAIYNFWGKIAINGLLTNLGLKRDKNQLRKYKKAADHNGTPRVPDNKESQ